MTSGEENVSAIGEFIRHHVEDVMDKWELCSFNNLCRDKYERLDREWICRDAQLMDKAGYGNSGRHCGRQRRM